MSEEWSFEKDDFLTTTPYEALYAYHKEPFTHAAKMEELAAYSVSKGFKGFKTMYKKYVESLKAQSGTIYIDNVTNFTNPVAAVDGHDTVEILLDGRAPQRVGPADDRDRGAQQRVVRLLVLDRDDRARRPAEVHGLVREGEGLERMIPRRMCGGHADKPEKGENQ